MKALFIGGTGNISTAVSRLAVANGIDLYLLNRGHTSRTVDGAQTIIADIWDVDAARAVLDGHSFDVVVNWIAYTADDVQRDIDLFAGRCGQYIFISSTSVYQKPVTVPILTEGVPLANPYLEYSRNKIAAEERLNRAYRDDGFPVLIVRPAHTYDTIIPTAVGRGASYVIPKRMLAGKPVPVHGDGTTLWTITHSEDFAKGFVPLMGNPLATGHAVHITSDFVLTWNQIYEQMAATLGVTPNLVYIPSQFVAAYDFNVGESLLGDKTYCLVFDNSKLRSFVPGFTATIPFHVGIRRTLAWFAEDAARQQYPPEDETFIEGLMAAYEHG